MDDVLLELKSIETIFHNETQLTSSGHSEGVTGQLKELNQQPSAVSDRSVLIPAQLSCPGVENFS